MNPLPSPASRTRFPVPVLPRPVAVAVAALALAGTGTAAAAPTATGVPDATGAAVATAAGVARAAGAAPTAPATLPGWPAAVPAAAQAAALALLRQAAQSLVPPGARVDAVPLQGDPRWSLAPCAQARVGAVAGLPAWGRTRVAVRCTAGADWAVTLPAQVRVVAPALVAAAVLPAGSVLQAASLTLVDTDWGATPALHGEAAALAGRTLARPLVPGQPLRETDLQRRRWFDAGERVRLDAVGAGYRVSGDAQALGPGEEGRAARLRTDSGRVVVAWPVGPRQAELR